MVIAAILVTALTAASGSLSPVTNTIGGIAIGAQRAELTRRLGKPVSVVKTGDALDPQLTYSGGMVVWMRPEIGGVGMIESRGPRYCTNTGVCPGDSVDRVRSRLGMPARELKMDDGAKQYSAVGEACWLEVVIAGGKVDSLALRCQL
jgi:hypothetical protein